MLAKNFKATIYLSGKSQWAIAQESQIHESTLSRILNGREKARADDPRLVRIAQAVGYTGNLLEV